VIKNGETLKIVCERHGIRREKMVEGERMGVA